MKRWSPLAVLLLLLPLWALGMFGRNHWTPDEPREAAIAHRMELSASKAVPCLGTTPFTEKPPLTYWASAACTWTFGKSPAAERLPNLLYAILGTLAVAGMGALAAGPLAGAVAGFAFGTFQLAHQVQIWLATDAPLLAGVALALLGLQGGLGASTTGRRLGWYLLAHLGLLLGFFSKNAVAWMVPILAFGAFIAWERRWRELWRWELHLGWLLQAACILPWVLAVAAHPQGEALLRNIFVDNLAGRFVRIEGVIYAEGHHNWWGKYLCELPGFLAPWTLLAAAALIAAWRGCRAEGPVRSHWRWALAVILPSFVLLSAANTARGIYLAPLMPGFALLLGLWAVRICGSEGSSRWDRWAWWGTWGAVALLALGAPGALGWLARRQDLPLARLLPLVLAAALVALVALVWLWLAARAWQARQPAAAAGRLCLALTAVVLGLGSQVLPIVNGWRDLRPIAVATAEALQERPVVLYRPDETTVALLDYHADVVLPEASVQEAIERALAADSRTWFLVRRHRKGLDEPALLAQQVPGLVSRREVVVPGGRSYVLMGR